MSYGQARPGVTMLDQLPDLDDLEMGAGVGNGMPPQGHMGPPTAQFVPHGAGLPPGSEERYQKYIRSDYRANPQSGMMNMEYYDSPGGYGAPNMGSSQYGTMEPSGPMHGGEMPMGPPPPPHEPQAPFINCIDIAKHVQECPICSKFYKNDNTVYIIAIVVLAIVCLLLLKRVLDV